MLADAMPASVKNCPPEIRGKIRGKIQNEIFPRRLGHISSKYAVQCSGRTVSSSRRFAFS
jgi:hypothetical protein